MEKSYDVSYSHLPESDTMLRPVSSESDRKGNFLSILNGNEEFILSTEGKIIGSNLEVVNLTGYEEWEIMSKSVAIFYLPQENEQELFKQHLLEASEKGVSTYEGWKLKKRGVKFFARMRFNAVRNSMGETTGYRMVLSDITHKVLYDEKILEVKEKYQSIYNNSFVGILTISAENFNILQSNRKAKDILGNKSDNLRDAFNDSCTFDRFLEQLKHHDTVKGFEFMVRPAQDQEKWVSLDCRIHRKENIIEGVVVDITMLRKQQDEINKLNKEVNTFIYHASHELRAPMSTILGILNLLTLESKDTTVSHYAAMIREKVKTQDQLLRDLTGVIYNNTAPVTTEPFDFDTEISEIVREFSDIYPGIRVHRHMALDRPFHTDLIRFRSVLRNILSNSYKYNSKIDPNIHIGITRTDDHVHVSISDNGIGMTDDQIMTIFNLFYRAHDGYPGNGLGLYLVKSILDVLGGHITIRSKKNQGTEVMIAIPFESTQS